MKVTYTEQLAPCATLAPQLVQKENEPGLTPETVILPVGIAWRFGLLITMISAVLRVKMFVLAKLSELDKTVSDMVPWPTLNVIPAMSKLPYR
jgi:hypothetical protein